VYVNTANPVSEITVAQLRSIFLGEITNWRQLGGKDAEIHLFAGESTSGTLAFFQDAVLRGKEPYPFWGKSTTKELIEVIASDPLAIGYASFGGTLSAKTLRVKSGQTSIAVEPSMENIRSLRYPIARAIYWGLKERSSSATEDFVRWALSSRGQLVVESVGYEPLTPSQRKSALGTLGPSSPERGGTGAAKNSLFR
jgi:phosphate transport system substrate-binding protein